MREKRHDAKEKIMKAKQRRKTSGDMRPEYDFSKGVRGKYYKRATESSNIVILAPDVAENFKNSRAVNRALRNLLHVAEETTRLTKRSNGKGRRRRVA